jgi:hypothetical protein
MEVLHPGEHRRLLHGEHAQERPVDLVRCTKPAVSVLEVVATVGTLQDRDTSVATRPPSEIGQGCRAAVAAAKQEGLPDCLELVQMLRRQGALAGLPGYIPHRVRHPSP